MGYLVTIDIPERPEGDPIEVPPHGFFENGATVNMDISEEEADRLANAYGITVQEEEEEDISEEGGEDE